MAFTTVFAYLAEKEDRAITETKLNKGKIYKVKSASVFYFSTRVYPRDSQHRGQCASTILQVIMHFFRVLISLKEQPSKNIT